MNSHITISDPDSDLALVEQEPSSEFIPVAAPVIGEFEIECVTDAIRSGWVSSIGPYIDKFETGFAKYIGVRHAIAVANGTTALHLALHALGIGPGDEVIIPDLTFAATAHAVIQTGATPVLVDVEVDTWCMDPRAVERAISEKTRAIMPVHLFGHPADMNAINELAAVNKLLVIEDAAEAHGAKVGERNVGSLGNVGAFSFYGNKVITTGEGGMLTTDDDDLAARLRFLKDHGMSKDRRYFHTELAFNYRMTNLQAALGFAQLSQIETFIQKKRQIFEWYREGLEDVEGLGLNVQRIGYRNIFWMISVVVDEHIILSRDEVCTRLKSRGIDTRPFFVPMSELPHLAKLRSITASGTNYSVSAGLSRGGFSLPSGCQLKEEQVRRIIESVRQLAIPGKTAHTQK
jgi:perosamine synthetase